jgi:hypothetical protein
MKNNEQLGYNVLYGEPGVGYGSDRSQENAGVPGHDGLTMHAEIGIKESKSTPPNRMYRVYAYTYHHEQDASREHVVEQLCGTGSSIEFAIEQFRNNAQLVGWPTAPVQRLIIELQESLAEAGYDSSDGKAARMVYLARNIEQTLDLRRG